MANRSVLTLFDKTKEKEIMLSEWNYTIPLVYYLLIGFDTEIIENEESNFVGIQGDWARGRDFVFMFLDWFQSVHTKWSDECNQLRSKLESINIDVSRVILEPTDIYAMNVQESFVQQALKELKLVSVVVEQVQAMIDSNESALSSQHWVISDAFDDVNLYMGLHPLAWDDL